MPTSDPRQYLSVLQKSLWFNSLPPVASQRLLSEATVQHLEHVPAELAGEGL